MRSFVLRHRTPDRTGLWLVGFAFAFVATIVASSYAVPLAFRALAWLSSERMSFGSIFLVPWYVWVPIACFLGYSTISGRQWSVFSLEPSRRFSEALIILNASPVPSDTRDPLLRRLMNVNEEIAIAAGCFPAQLYVQQKDYSVNALTIGESAPAICVTRGALRTLKRAELQAVIAHEYGHVVNDDVGRNTRLLYWLGALLPHGFGEPRTRPLRVVGWCLAIGVPSFLLAWLFDIAGGVLEYIGQWLAFVPPLCLVIIAVQAISAVWRLGSAATRMTQAGFTRQREFEADAISAQLTREPDALASVLRKIAGVRARSPLSPRHAAMFAHLCIASGLFGTEDERFATHPTLEERLKALGHPLTSAEREQLAEDPDVAVERYAAEVNAELGILYAAEPVAAPAPDAVTPVSDASDTTDAPVDAPFSAAPDITHAVQLLGRFPPGIRAALRTPAGAWAAAHALIDQRIPTGATDEQCGSIRLFTKTLANLGETARLPLLELAVPVLRAGSLADRQALFASLRLHMESAETVSLRAFVYFMLLTKPLETSRPLASHMRVTKACALLLGAAAYAFTRSDFEAQAAFSRGRILLDPEAELPVRQRLGLPQLERALEKLRWLGAGREHVLRALAALVAHDGRIEVREVEFVRAVALAIDWPMPPLETTSV